MLSKASIVWLAAAARVKEARQSSTRVEPVRLVTYSPASWLEREEVLKLQLPATTQAVPWGETLNADLA